MGGNGSEAGMSWQDAACERSRGSQAFLAGACVASVPGKKPLGPLFVVSGEGSRLNQEHGNRQ